MKGVYILVEISEHYCQKGNIGEEMHLPEMKKESMLELNYTGEMC